MSVLALGTKVARAAGDADHLLRGAGRHSAHGGRVPLGALSAMLISGGFVYGAVLGSYGGRLLQAVFTAVKVPLLLGASTAICLPSFYVFNALLGLREDFAACLRGILSAQAALALVLLSLAPITTFVHASGSSYHFTILFNGALFAVATFSGQLVLGRHWRPLIAKSGKHRVSRWVWIVTYIFVAVQMAWVLRPFVGTEGLATTFFRADAWDNAYVKVATILWRWLGGGSR